MIDYRKATMEDLEQIWNRSIRHNPDDPRYLRWKQEFIANNISGAAATFVICIDGDCVGEGTLLLSPDCRAVQGRTCLCDGETCANINALRIRKEFEGRGHISRLVNEMESYARSIGLSQITIGVEAAEARNLAIYLHWGFTEFLMHEEEDGTLVLYYGKDLR